TTVMQTLDQVMHADPVPPRRLQPGVPLDLQAICLKCLEKDPAKRYADGGELADEVRRFLDGRPVQARQTPAWERAWKWAKRRPALAGLLGVSAVALVALVV